MDFTKYKIKVAHPIKRDFSTTYYYLKGQVLLEHVPGCIREEVLDQESYNAALKEHRADIDRMWNEFKNDLFVDLGIENNPKKDKLWELVRDEDGFEDIYWEAVKLVALIEE